MVKQNNVNWIVNDMAELGVEIGGRCFFLYKGASLEYEDGKHDDGTPILIRRVGKREFGEVSLPIQLILEDRIPERYTQELAYCPKLSLIHPDDPEWSEYQWHPMKKTKDEQEA